MSDNDPQPSPGQDNVNAAGVAQNVGNGAMGNGQPGAVQNIQGLKRPRTTGDDDDDDDDGKPNRERRKIEIKFIQDKSRRHITFSKRKAGIMKKVCNFCFYFNSCDYYTFGRLLEFNINETRLYRHMSYRYLPVLKFYFW